jgi:hypothetical protein
VTLGPKGDGLRPTKTEKSEEISCSEVSPVAWTYVLHGGLGLKRIAVFDFSAVKFYIFLVIKTLNPNPH